jgi:hypothetical protein
MVKSQQTTHIALRNCKTLYELKGDDLHWFDIEEVCSRLDERHTRALNAALEYAREHELLACSPLPVRSIMLTHKGLMQRAAGSGSPTASQVEGLPGPSSGAP